MTAAARPGDMIVLRVAKFLNAMSWFWDGVDAESLRTSIDQVLWMINPEKLTMVPGAGGLGSCQR